MKDSDKIATALVLLFIIKPVIDLFWSVEIFSVGSIHVSLLHLSGIFVFLYFGRFLITSFLKYHAPYTGVFKLFIAINIFSISVTALNEQVSLVAIIDLLLRIFDSYIVYNAAFFAASSNASAVYFRLVRAVSIGTFFAVIINMMAIVFGFGGVQAGSNNSIREFGLYHDSGTLSNVALYNIMFTTYMHSLLSKKTAMYTLYGLVTILISLYLIFLGLSRSVFIQLFVFGMIYITYVKKGAGKLGTVFFVVAILGLGAAAGLDYMLYKDRFASELDMLDSSTTYVTKKDKSVDLGQFEQFGSGRGQAIAYKLDEIIQRPAYQIIIGRFNTASSHSDYIDVLSRNGIIGLGVYLLLLFLLLFKAYSLVRSRGRFGKVDGIFAVLAFSLIVLYMLYSIPFRPLRYTTLAWFMWTILGYSFGRKYWGDRYVGDVKEDLEQKENPVSSGLSLITKRSGRT